MLSVLLGCGVILSKMGKCILEYLLTWFLDHNMCDICGLAQFLEVSAVSNITVFNLKLWLICHICGSFVADCVSASFVVTRHCMWYVSHQSSQCYSININQNRWIQHYFWAWSFNLQGSRLLDVPGSVDGNGLAGCLKAKSYPTFQSWYSHANGMHFKVCVSSFLRLTMVLTMVLFLLWV